MLRSLYYPNSGLVSYDDYDLSIREDLPFFIQNRLQRLGKTQNWLANQVGIHRASITRYIQRKEFPSQRTLQRIYDTLLSSIDDDLSYSKIKLRCLPNLGDLTDFFFFLPNGFGLEVFPLVESYDLEDTSIKQLIRVTRDVAHTFNLDVIDSYSCLIFSDLSELSFLSLGYLSSQSWNEDILRAASAYRTLEHKLLIAD